MRGIPLISPCLYTFPVVPRAWRLAMHRSICMQTYSATSNSFGFHKDTRLSKATATHKPNIAVFHFSFQTLFWNSIGELCYSEVWAFFVSMCVCASLKQIKALVATLGHTSCSRQRAQSLFLKEKWYLHESRVPTRNLRQRLAAGRRHPQPDC